MSSRTWCNTTWNVTNNVIPENKSWIVPKYAYCLYIPLSYWWGVYICLTIYQDFSSVDFSLFSHDRNVLLRSVTIVIGFRGFRDEKTLSFDYLTFFLIIVSSRSMLWRGLKLTYNIRKNWVLFNGFFVKCLNLFLIKVGTEKFLFRY